MAEIVATLNSVHERLDGRGSSGVGTKIGGLEEIHSDIYQLNINLVRIGNQIRIFLITIVFVLGFMAGKLGGIL